MLRPVYHLRPDGAAAPVSHTPAPAYFAPAPPATELSDQAFLKVAGWIFSILIVVRMSLTDPLMNSIVNYSEEGGSLIEKIHPATYGMILLLLFCLLRVQVVCLRQEMRLIRQLLTLIGVIFGLAIFLQAIGRSVSMGYLLETYIGACLCGILVLVFPPAQRRMFGHVMMGYVVVDALLAIAEKGAGVRLLPYPYEEISFRPTALTSHPLAIGLLNAGAVVFVLATRWPALIKAGALLVICVGTFAAGARTGAIATSIAAVIGLALTEMPASSPESRFRLRAILFGTILFVGPAMLLIADAAGFLERFHGGYFDENAKARVDVYQVFDWVSANDILFGADLVQIKKMVFERLGILVESSVVVFVFQFGLFGAVLFVGTIIWTFYRLAAGSDPRGYIGAVLFLAVAMSNDAMSGKHPYIMMMFLLLLAFRHDGNDAYGRPKGYRWGEGP